MSSNTPCGSSVERRRSLTSSNRRWLARARRACSSALHQRSPTHHSKPYVKISMTLVSRYESAMSTDVDEPDAPPAVYPIVSPTMLAPKARASRMSRSRPRTAGSASTAPARGKTTAASTLFGTNAPAATPTAISRAPAGMRMRGVKPRLKNQNPATVVMPIRAATTSCSGRRAPGTATASARQRTAAVAAHAAAKPANLRSWPDPGVSPRSLTALSRTWYAAGVGARAPTSDWPGAALSGSHLTLLQPGKALTPKRALSHLHHKAWHIQRLPRTTLCACAAQAAPAPEPSEPRNLRRPV
jgi:hypothetical protein